MKAAIYEKYRSILRAELITAEGCTEPIAVAYAAAKARDVLGAFPENLSLVCSGNVIKNVMGVTIPHSGGRRGMDVAAILGALGGNADRALEVLDDVTEEQIARIDPLLRSGFCRCSLAEGVEKLYIGVTATRGNDSAFVEIRLHHTNITRIYRNGEVLFDATAQTTDEIDRSCLDLHDILGYAAEEDMDVLRTLLCGQIEKNTAISREGLSRPYGAQVGRCLLEAAAEDDRHTRICAAAAAASDARMGGCAMPVVINSGSGNQGIAVSVPVIEYARQNDVEEGRLIRALAVSNLVSLSVKRYIGALSAFCGVVCAASGAGAAITWLRGGDENEVAMTIVNSLGTISGMVCDGAKPSCAAKIAAAVRVALMADEMSRRGCAFQAGEGIISGNIEDTIRRIGILGKEGMYETDNVILRMMLDRSTV